MSITAGGPRPILEETKQQETPLSFGEQLVGIKFNPSGDDDVNEVKQLAAKIANIVNDKYQSSESSKLSKLIYERSMGEILNAQMNSVKFLTLKY